MSLVLFHSLSNCFRVYYSILRLKSTAAFDWSLKGLEMSHRCSQVVFFLPSAASRTISFFYFQWFLVLFWFIFFFGREEGQQEIRSFVSVLRSPVTPFDWEAKRRVRILRRMLTVSPGTLFISHEHANFLFSVFRVVQGEAKTPKIMGCCRAIFAFLHALKIGTFRGKWTLEWVFKTSQFFRLALYFLINSKLAFFFACFWTMPNGNCKKIWFGAQNSVKNNFLLLRLETSLAWKISLSLFLSPKSPMNVRKKFVFQQAMGITSWAKLNKKLGGRRVKSWPNVATKQLQSCKKVQPKSRDIACKAKFFPPYLRQVAKIYVATSHSVVWLETIEISKQRTAFIRCFAQEVDWCLKDCDKQRLQTTVSINLWKIFAGHTGDWFDVRTASICTTDL